MGVKKLASDEASKAIILRNLYVQDIHRNMANIDHNNKKTGINETTELDRYRLANEKKSGCQNDVQSRCSVPIAYGLHKKEDEYGKESITRRVRVDVYGWSRRAADLKCKCARDSRECMEAIRRTINVKVPTVIVVIGLLLMFLATSCAAPTKSRQGRSAHHEKSPRSYLEEFGYLKKGSPEIGNLLMGDVSQSYEDEFRIAIKTLQEFGGIPVTGEIDHATKELMKKKRCGRPDREPDDDESGRRKKRFAVQGEKWKYTNLTWRSSKQEIRLSDDSSSTSDNSSSSSSRESSPERAPQPAPARQVDPATAKKRKSKSSQSHSSHKRLSQVRRPSQLDPGGTRSVLARALDVWAQASRLTFTEINSDEADIVVSFAKRYHDDAYPFDGRGSILAHAFFPGTGRGGDAHFDDDELWLLQPRNDDEEGTSLFAVAAHEFGHSLGLSHSSVKGALMFPWYQGIQPNFVLPEDDRNGIQQMYGPKVQRTWAKIPYYRPIETPPPPTTTTTTTTTTSTRRPYIHQHHPGRHPNHRNYTPYPRAPSRYPAYYPERPNYPERPTYPERPSYPERPNYPERPSYPERPTYYPDRRHYNTTDEHPRRTNHNHYPRTTETTTHATTFRPRYPHIHSDYPNHPRQNYPTNPGQDYPKKKPYYPVKTTTVKPTPPSDIPDTCDTNYDAVALIRGELFIFKNRYHWRIGADGRYSGYPIEISRMWSGLPKNLTHVDAVYERPDRKIAFFVGKHLYLFDSQYLMPGYPKALSRLGLPESLEKLDAAMVWGHNGKTYFYSGTMYWKYDEDLGRVELDYPRDMAMWKGVGYNIDSVFQWKDGKTYFFKGKGFWKFNDLQMRVEHEKQLPSAPFWMACPEERAGRRAPFRALPAPGSTLRSPSSSSTPTYKNNLLLSFASLLLVIITYARIF